MLMGSSRGVGALGLGDSQLTWDNSTQRFISSPNAIATGCWDASKSAFVAIPSGGCNSQLLYTNDGVLPGGSSVSVLPIASNASNTGSGKVVSGVLQPPVSGTFTPDIMLGSFDATVFVKDYWPWLLGGVGAIVLLTAVK